MAVLRHRRQKLNGVKLGLAGKTQGGFYRERKFGHPQKLGGDSQLLGCLFLQLHRLGVFQRVQIRRTFLKIAVDGKGVYKLLVTFHRPLVGPGVLGGFFLPKGPEKPVVDQSVLGGDLGGSAPSLAASDPGCLQHHRLSPPLFEKIGGENSRHSATDYRHIRLMLS